MLFASLLSSSIITFWLLLCLSFFHHYGCANNNDYGGLLIPLYVWPTFDGTSCVDSHYQKVVTTAAVTGTKIIVVVNPNNGPNYNNDLWMKASYDACIAYLKTESNIEVIGYIHTKKNYPIIDGYRSMDDIQSDIDLWKNNYTGIDGIFIDEMTNRWPHDAFDSINLAITTYRLIIDYVLASYDRVVINPGGPYFEEIMFTTEEKDYSNVIYVVFESPSNNFYPLPTGNCTSILYNDSQGSFQPGPWCNYVPNWDGIESLRSAMNTNTITTLQSAVMIYSYPTDTNNITIEQLLQYGIDANIGWFYITDKDVWSDTPSQEVIDSQAEFFQQQFPGQKIRLIDQFDDARRFKWGIFEEIVEGNTCYQDGIGSVQYNESVNEGRRNGGSLQIYSNEVNAYASNHVLATRSIREDRGVPGNFFYSVWFYVQDVDALKDTQTGPELSIQNTFPVGIDKNNNKLWRTNIAGLQYVGATESWNIWTKPDNTKDKKRHTPETAAWIPLGGPALDTKGWWKLTYTARFQKHKRSSKYSKFVLLSPKKNGSGKTRYKMNLSNFRIAQENRGWNEGSLFVTLEGQNLWTNCTQIKQQQNYYDNVKVVGPRIPKYPQLSFQKVYLNLGDTSLLDVSEEQGHGKVQLYILIGHPDVTLDASKKKLTFTATALGGVGIKYMACYINSFLCSEEWWDVQVI